jgi:hypothetical protein
MKVLLLSIYALVLLLLIPTYNSAQNTSVSSKESYLSWNRQEASKIREIWRVKGRVGGFFDTRILSTDKSFNYKLRATLMSPEAIRATARIAQISNQLTDKETNALVAGSEKVESLILIIEIDPREGSGVIPNNWRAFLKPKNIEPNSGSAIRGIIKNDLREIATLQASVKRDYDYDIFTVEFPLKDENGNPFWKTVPSEIELTVGIYGNEGRVNWKVTEALKTRIENLMRKEEGK